MKRPSSTIATVAVKAGSSTPQRRTHHIAHFDGMRGLGALIVLLTHLSVTLYPSMTSGIDDLSGIHLLTYVARSPFDLFTSGNFAVGIFFVLSGYVMSRLVCGSRESILGLSVRRYVRLDGPALASCLLSVGLLSTGLYHNQSVSTITASPWLGQWFDFTASVQSALYEGLIGIFVHPTSMYNANLWTMYTELWGSLAIFVVHRAIGNRLIRLGLILIMAIVAFVFFRNYGFFCILAGSASFLWHDLINEESVSGLPRRFAHLQSAFKIVRSPAVALSSVLAGVYFGTYPDFGSFEDPGPLYGWLRASSELWVYFYHALGSILIVHFIHGVSSLRNILASPPLLYLGKISFPLYLMNLPIICSFGAWMIEILHTRLPYNAMAIGVAFSTALCCFAVAEIYGRAIDQPCLALSRRLSYRIDAFIRRQRVVAPETAD